MTTNLWSLQSVGSDFIINPIVSTRPHWQWKTLELEMWKTGDCVVRIGLFRPIFLTQKQLISRLHMNRAFLPRLSCLLACPL